MKIIEQSHEILHMDGLDLIERAGRTCYKSEEKIGCLTEGCDYSYGAQACRNCGSSSAHRFAQMLIKRGHEAMIEHGSATVKFITNRGVTHELVRHRVASFGQESTRYVNYGGKEMEFIQPVWLLYGEDGFGPWFDSMVEAELTYGTLIDIGWRPEQAREVLPNSLKTEIVVTANYREWRHIFKLRALGTTGKPHPQMQALMLPVLEEFKDKLPALFGDLTA